MHLSDSARRFRGPAFDILCGAAYALVYTVLIFSWPALPSQDAPLWVYEAGLLRTAAQQLAADGCRMVGALPPNALAQGVLAGLMTFVTADIAARVYMSACVSAFVAALVYLCRARDASGRSPALLAVLPLCAGYPFFHGFLNYMAALPVLAFGMGFVLRHPEGRGWRGQLALCVVPTLAYLCHGTALGVWGVLVLVQLWVGRSWRFAVRAAVGLVPVFVLVLLYIAQRSSEGAGVTWSAGSLLATVVYRLRSPLRFFSVFQGFTPTYDDPSLSAIAPLLVSMNGLYGPGLALACVGWAVFGRRSVDPGARLLALSVLWLSVAFVVMPHDVAKMLNPAERLVIPLACFGAAGLSGVVSSHQLRARSMLVALLIAPGASVATVGTRAAQAALAVAQARVRERAPSVQAQDVRGASLPARTGWASLLPRHQVLSMQGLLEAAQTRREFAMPFETGLFRCRSRQGLSHDLNGLLQSEQSLILLGERAQLDALSALLVPTHRALEKGPGYAVLQLSAAEESPR